MRGVFLLLHAFHLVKATQGATEAMNLVRPQP